MGIGGTLGLTSAYGVNDRTITRKRVEADLAVFCDYRTKYVGMLAACKEQLNWDVERYAKLPIPPELLPLKPLPSWLYILGYDADDKSARLAAGYFLYFGFIPWILGSLIAGLLGNGFFWALFHFVSWLCWKVCVFTLPIYLISVIIGMVTYFTVTVANGQRPQENARRQRAYKAACSAAMKAAEPVKAAQDYRLTVQIRELDGLIMTITEKAKEVRKILKAL